MRFVIFIFVSIAIHAAVMNLYFVQKNRAPHAEQVIIQVSEEKFREAPPVPVSVPVLPVATDKPAARKEIMPAVKSISAGDFSEKVVEAKEVPSVPVIIPPQLVTPPKPVYPVSERKSGHEGNVFISVLVGDDGSLLDATIKKSSGYKALDRAALIAVRKCSFKSGLCNGVPCRGVFVVEVLFKLK